MNEDAKLHLRSGWLGHLEASLSDLIVNKGKVVRFHDGATVYGLDQRQDSIIGILNGVIQMWVTMNEQDPRFGHLAGPGFWFGETEAVTGRGGIIEMVATGDVELLAVSRKIIDEIADTHKGMWPALTLLAIQNQGLAIGAADDLMIRNSTKRVAALLLRLSSNRNAYQGVAPLAQIPVTWGQLAEASNLSRSKVATILADLVALQLIKTGQRSIQIVDVDGLKSCLS